MCLVEKDIRGMHMEAIGILTKINSVFDDMKQHNSLFGDPIDMKRFESCIGTKAEFIDLLVVKIGRIEHCMESTFSEKKNKEVFVIGLVGWDGQHSTITNYNQNFEKIKYLNDRIVVKLCVALKRTCLYKRSGMDGWPTERESRLRGVRRLSD